MQYQPLKVLIKKIILIDGIARSGKLLTGSLVSSFENSEHLEFGLNFEHFCPAVEFRKVDLEFAKAYLSNHLNELIYNKYLSRNVNFRPSDRTGVANSINLKTYKKRLNINEGDQIIKLIKKENKQVPFITHNILVSINALNELKINYKMIEIFRNPFSLVMSWYKRGLGYRIGKDYRMFTLLIKKYKKFLPWYDVISNTNKSAANDLEKCINYVHFLTKKSVENYQKLEKKNKKKILITSYERIVENTDGELKIISNFLNTKLSIHTNSFVKKEKCPKRIDREKIDYYRSYIKTKVKKNIFKKLVSLEKEFNNSIYGLTK